MGRPTTPTTARSRPTSPRLVATSATSSARRSSGASRTWCSAPYPKSLALASGLVDPVTGQSLDPVRRRPQCTGATVDTCNYWQCLQGTSMASPHAVGVAALIVSEFGKGQRHGKGRTMDPAKVERILLSTATDIACPSPVISYAAEGAGRDTTRRASKSPDATPSGVTASSTRWRRSSTTTDHILSGVARSSRVGARHPASAVPCRRASDHLSERVRLAA